MIDKGARHHPDGRCARSAGDLVALVTPIVKAFITDNGIATSTRCMPIGGHGYIRHEWGMEQFVRDAHQHDLRGHQPSSRSTCWVRKVLGDNGAEEVRRHRHRLIEDEGVNRRCRFIVNPILTWATSSPEVDHRDRHEGDGATPTRWAPPRSTTCVAGHLVFATVRPPRWPPPPPAAFDRSTPPSCRRRAAANAVPETATLIRPRRQQGR